MKLDQTTRVYMGISARLERLANTVKSEGTLPPWQMPMTPAEQERMAEEKRLREVAELYVGGT
jgi:hypothetical protein